MSIASEITRLQGVKADILQAISEKGVSVPAGSALDDCPGLISEIGEMDSITIGSDVYPVVLINGQYWMASNLRYTTNDYKYPNNDSNNKNKHGLLYRYMTIQNDVLPLLPKGFRLPTQLDFIRLFNFDSNPLDYFAEEAGGNNSNGFNMLNTGFVDADGIVKGFNEYGVIVTDTYYDADVYSTSSYYIKNFCARFKTSSLDVNDEYSFYSKTNDTSYFSYRFVCDKLV